MKDLKTENLRQVLSSTEVNAYQRQLASVEYKKLIEFIYEMDKKLILLNSSLQLKEKEETTFKDWLFNNKYVVDLDNDLIYKDGEVCNFKIVQTKYRLSMKDEL